MGYTKVKAIVVNPQDRKRRLDLELIVDTGVIYSLLPRSLLEELGVKPIGRRRFRLASGEIVEYHVGEVYIEVEGVGVTSLVVFGEEESIPLLGVTTLELLGFEVDPISGKLKPMELLLLWWRSDE
jgi:clan AA aspartic protease